MSSRTYIVLSKLQGFQDHFQTCKANPEKGRGGEIDVVNVRILPLWHNEVRKQFLVKCLNTAIIFGRQV